MEADTPKDQPSATIAASRKNRLNPGRRNKAKKKREEEAYCAGMDMRTQLWITKDDPRFFEDNGILVKLKSNENGLAAVRSLVGADIVAAWSLRDVIIGVLERFGAYSTVQQFNDPTYTEQQRAFITVSTMQTSMRLRRIFGDIYSVLPSRNFMEMTLQEERVTASCNGNLGPIVDFLNTIERIDIGNRVLIPIAWLTDVVGMYSMVDIINAYIADPSAAGREKLAESCFRGYDIWNPTTRRYGVFYPCKKNITYEDIALYFKFVDGAKNAGFKFELVANATMGYVLKDSTISQGDQRSRSFLSSLHKPVLPIGRPLPVGDLSSTAAEDILFLHPWYLPREGAEYNRRNSYRTTLDLHLHHHQQMGLP